MKKRLHFQSPIGTICIEECNGAIVALYIEESYDGLQDSETDLLKKTKGQLEEYFRGQRQQFDVPIALEGTVFQHKVWEALQTIPYGKTCSYKEIAERIGKPNACRAVGGANNKNPILIIVPCHRVIGANGDLVGFGEGLDVKSYLLELEKQSE